jgi:uncharacterized protein (TIRG00374 family)
MDDLKSTPTPKLVMRPLRYLPTLILLGLAVHLLLPQITSLEHSLNVIEHMALWAVAAAVIAQILSYVGLGYLLRGAVRVAGGNLPTLQSALIATAASDIGLVAGGPVGNAAATYRWVHGSGINKEGALLAGSVPSLFNNLLLVVISISGLLHLLIAHDLSTFQVIAFGTILLVLGLIVGILLWGVHHREALIALVARIRSRWARLRHQSDDPPDVAESMTQVFATWDALRAGGWRQPLLGAAMNIGFDMLTLYFIFAAAGHQVSPGVLLAGYGLPLLLGKVSFLPGGVGIVEGTMTALYDGLGVPDGVTVVVILAYRAISFWLPTLIGVPLIPYLQHSTKSARLKGGR